MRGSFATVVLAGGEGLRMGGDKPLHLLGGETLIARAHRKAQGWSYNVAVAVRTEAQIGETQAKLIFDVPGIDGPIAGLASALRFGKCLGQEFLLTLPCDTPFLPQDLPARLAGGIGGANAAVAMSAGQIHPACTFWRVEALDRLDAYLISSRRSLRGFAAEIGLVGVEWDAEPLDPFFNINDGDDLARAEAMLEA